MCPKANIFVVVSIIIYQLAKYIYDNYFLLIILSYYIFVQISS